MVSRNVGSAAEYLASLDPETRATVAAVRRVIKKNLPKGLVESVQYGMLAYVVPLKTYPKTYNGQPLAAVALAAQKHHCSLYLMGVYGDPELSRWFAAEWTRSGKRLNMGKSCVRFKGVDDLALDAIAGVVARVTPAVLIAQHDAVHGSDGARRRGRSAAAKTKAPSRSKRTPKIRASKARASPGGRAPTQKRR